MYTGGLATFANSHQSQVRRLQRLNGRFTCMMRQEHWMRNTLNGEAVLFRGNPT